ncbi:hypothetical protein Pla52o_47430 [Novipirellula galeiformis]|uniref:Uncharacterized protein n=1 Tax=Novipirellula galeiformis TaxID=2528004 RepID=A0A5C6C7U8_9BACT|nr:hypothetical protein [Novipirellula galeiformis]TWU20228.1 hypothetical protein Pla52o_47430 [Novipirellula galeiformis]
MEMMIKPILPILLRLSVATIFMVALAAVVRSQDPAAELKSDVLQWVDELDASSLAKRKAAENSLIQAGPEVLPLLPERKPGMSIEASERLTRVRKTLLSLRTKAETQPSAVVIRLDGVKTVGEAFEAISRDSGVEFEYHGDTSVPIQAVATPLSFWHAVDLILDQANLDVNFYGGERESLQIVTRESDRPSRVDSAAYAGVYRIEPTSVNSRRVLNHPKLSALNLSMEISWEPRMTPIGLSIPIAQLRGTLDDGAALKPQETGETIDIATNSEISFSEFYLPMQLPAGQPEKVESLSGVIKALLPGKRQVFELALSEVGNKKKLDAMEVQVEELRKNGPLHEIRVAITLDDAGRSLESHRQWIFENSAYVKRPDGSRADHLGYEVYRQAANGVGIGYFFDLGDAVIDSTLIYESPTSVVPNEVSFVLQDILLP